MIKTLLTTIGGVAGVGFFGTWGISQAVNKFKNDGLEWFGVGVNAIVGENQKTKGIAIKIPYEDFELSCNNFPNDSEGERKQKCEKVKEKLNKIKGEVKGGGNNLENETKSGYNEGNDDLNCGNITWNVDLKDQKTNLLNLSKFLIMVYCFESDEKHKDSKMKNDIIENLNKNKDDYVEGELIAGVFNVNDAISNSGDTLIRGNYEHLKKLIKDNERLNEWTEILDKFIGDKLILRIDSSLKSNGNNKWLLIQRNNVLEQQGDDDIPSG